jgi:two-component system OmpR family sensor kinase
VAMRPWRHWTVRSRMVVAVAFLGAVALVATDVVGMFALDSYLVNRVDDQLDFVANQPRNGGPRPSEAQQNDVVRPGPRSFLEYAKFYVFSSDGTVEVGTSADPDPKNFGDLAAHAKDGKPFNVEGADAAWRVRVFNGRNGRYNAAAVSLRDVEDVQDNLLTIDVIVTAIVLLLIAGAAATVVRVGLRPLTRMEQTATEIAFGGDLSHRVTDADPHTESGRLGTALNTMLDRIQEAADDSADSERRLRQFLADAAHELRTPLTSIQGFAELYRRGGAPPGPALDEAMTCIENEVGRMRLLVNDLLTLARLDEERPMERHLVDLLAVGADTVRDAHVRVPTRFVQLEGLDEYSSTWEPVAVLGDEARIRQVATNLVTNALQHTPENSRVVVRVGRVVESAAGTSGGREPTVVIGDGLPDGVPVAAIEVSDTGPGMEPVDAQRVFERLYRAEGSRSRRHGGAGLGLAIVAAIVTAHHGLVQLWTAPGEGARFRVLLPAEPPVLDEELTE